jgi:hypothetical protein
MRRLSLLLASSLLGCGSENDVASHVVQYGPPNPLELTNPSRIDRILQTTVPQVDALFVVDNSCSMEEEQASLGENFPAMLDWFVGSGLDYHVGVVSTDMRDPLEAGRLRTVGGVRWVQQDTSSPEGIFASMVQMGTSGDASEQGRAAAYTALELLGSTDNLGFARPGAGMHLTFVSDENDASGESPISRGEWIDYLASFRGSSRMVSASSIVGPVTGCPDIGSPGTEYMEVSAAVGGVVWPICSPDWTEVLDELGFLAVGLSREFFLSQLPVPATLEVRVVDPGGTVFAVPSEGWSYSSSRNSITFDSLVPEPLSVVEVEYELLSSVRDLDDPDTPPPEE